MNKHNINKCTNKYADNNFYHKNPDKYNTCLTTKMNDITNIYKNICRCDNGMLGYTTTGNKNKCICYGTTHPTFTLLDNYQADNIIYYSGILRLLILFIIIIPFIISYKKYSISSRYIYNAKMTYNNLIIVPILFGGLALYTTYLIINYYY